MVNNSLHRQCLAAFEVDIFRGAELLGSYPALEHLVNYTHRANSSPCAQCEAPDSVVQSCNAAIDA